MLADKIWLTVRVKVHSKGVGWNSLRKRLSKIPNSSMCVQILLAILYSGVCIVIYFQTIVKSIMAALFTRAIDCCWSRWIVLFDPQYVFLESSLASWSSQNVEGPIQLSVLQASILQDGQGPPYII